MKTILRKTRKLRKAGGGVVLHLPAELVKQFHVKPGTEVEVRLVERDGRPVVEVPLPTGFSPEELLDLAKKRKWETEYDGKPSAGHRYLVLRHGNCRIRYDSNKR